MHAFGKPPVGFVLSEVARTLDHDIVVNLQGDEPMLDPATLDLVAASEMSTAPAESDGTPPLEIPPDGRLFAHVWIEPAQPPKTLMLQYFKGGWLHRAVWGDLDAIAGLSAIAVERQQFLARKSGDGFAQHVQFFGQGEIHGVTLSVGS